MADTLIAPDLRPDVCWYCDQSGTDHKHGVGRSCGDCCGMHGHLAHLDEECYKWVQDCIRAKNERISKAEQENVALRAELEDWKSAGRMEEEEFQDICASEQIRPSTCCQPKYCHLAPFHEIKLLREELAARGREGEMEQMGKMGMLPVKR